jgi:hypothetical protein
VKLKKWFKIFVRREEVRKKKRRKRKKDMKTII